MHHRTRSLKGLITLSIALGCSDVCDGSNNVPSISSANYDRRCIVDTDCVAVPEGDVCTDCVLSCEERGVVNTSAEEKYERDLVQLIKQYPQKVCRCIGSGLPCCIAGICHRDLDCDRR